MSRVAHRWLWASGRSGRTSTSAGPMAAAAPRLLLSQLRVDGVARVLGWSGDVPVTARPPGMSRIDAADLTRDEAARAIEQLLRITGRLHGAGIGLGALDLHGVGWLDGRVLITDVEALIALGGAADRVADVRAVTGFARRLLPQGDPVHALLVDALARRGRVVPTRLAARVARVARVRHADRGGRVGQADPGSAVSPRRPSRRTALVAGAGFAAALLATAGALLRDRSTNPPTGPNANSAKAHAAKANSVKLNAAATGTGCAYRVDRDLNGTADPLAPASLVLGATRDGAFELGDDGGGRFRVSDAGAGTLVLADWDGDGWSTPGVVDGGDTWMFTTWPVAGVPMRAVRATLPLPTCVLRLASEGRPGAALAPPITAPATTATAPRPSAP